MPKNAATSIQKSAPGPPVPMAVATPTMLPVPTVAERAVQSAPNELTSPETPSPSSWWNMYLKARLRLNTWLRRRQNVRIRPVTSTAPMSGTPHTQPSTVSTRLVKDVSQSLVASTDAATPGLVCAASGSEATVCKAVGALCANAEKRPPQKVAAENQNRAMCAFMGK